MDQPKRPSSQTALLLQLVQDVADIKAGITSVADHETRIRELDKGSLVECLANRFIVCWCFIRIRRNHSQHVRKINEN